MSEIAVIGPQAERPTGFRGLMRDRNYALLWSGQLVSEMGNRFHWVAVSLWIYFLTRSAAAVSLAISSMFVGGLVVSLWAGALVDRMSRKNVLILSDLFRAILVALIPKLIKVDIRLVYADLALVSVATAFFRPAIFAVIPQIMDRKNLLSANSFFSAMDTGTEILGPALAGLIAFRYHYAPLLYVDALTYVVSAACVLAMRVPTPSLEPGSKPTFSGLWSGIVEGAHYVRHDRLQWGLFVLIFPAYLVGSGLNALQTPLAKGVVGVTDAQFGTYNGVWGFGFLASSLLLGWYGRFFSKSLLILGGFFSQFLFTALMGVSRSYGALLATAFGVGFMNTLSYIGLSTVLMEHTPGTMLGRVVSTRQAALHFVRILSPLAFGEIGDRVGIRSAILLMTAVGAIGTALVTPLVPALRGTGTLTAYRRLSALQRLGNLVLPLDSAFDQSQQVRLNITALVVAGIAWIALASRHFSSALLLLFCSFVLMLVGAAGKRRKWLP